MKCKWINFVEWIGHDNQFYFLALGVVEDKENFLKVRYSVQLASKSLRKNDDVIFWDLLYSAVIIKKFI